MEFQKQVEVINLTVFNREFLPCQCRSLIGHYKKNNHEHCRLDCSRFNCKNKSIIGSAVLLKEIGCLKVFIIPSCRSCAKLKSWYEIDKCVKLREANVCGTDEYQICFSLIKHMVSLFSNLKTQIKETPKELKHPEKFEIYKHNKKLGLIIGTVKDKWFISKHQESFLLNDNKEISYMHGMPISANGGYILSKDDRYHYLHRSGFLYKIFKLSNGNYKVVDTKIGTIIYDLTLSDLILLNNETRVEIESPPDSLLLSYKGIFCKDGKFIKWNGEVLYHNCPVSSVHDIHQQCRELILIVKQNLSSYKLYVYSIKKDTILWSLNLNSVEFQYLKPFVIVNGIVLNAFTGERAFFVNNGWISFLKKSKNGYLAAIQ